MKRELGNAAIAAALLAWCRRLARRRSAKLSAIERWTGHRPR